MTCAPQRGNKMRGEAGFTVELSADGVTADVEFTGTVNIETGQPERDSAWHGMAGNEDGLGGRNAPEDTISGRFYGQGTGLVLKLHRERRVRANSKRLVLGYSSALTNNLNTAWINRQAVRLRALVIYYRRGSLRCRREEGGHSIIVEGCWQVWEQSRRTRRHDAACLQRAPNRWNGRVLNWHVRYEGTPPSAIILLRSTGKPAGTERTFGNSPQTPRPAAWENHVYVDQV